MMLGDHDIYYDAATPSTSAALRTVNYAASVIVGANGTRAARSLTISPEERDHLSAAEIGSQNWPVLLIDPV